MLILQYILEPLTTLLLFPTTSNTEFFLTSSHTGHSLKSDSATLSVSHSTRRGHAQAQRRARSAKYKTPPASRPSLACRPAGRALQYTVHPCQLGDSAVTITIELYHHHDAAEPLQAVVQGVEASVGPRRFRSSCRPTNFSRGLCRWIKFLILTILRFLRMNALSTCFPWT